ncbi:MAG TPA: NosD domain-containing protein [bacterium]|nr:NosD domain-containing protein [bacterium]
MNKHLWWLSGLFTLGLLFIGGGLAQASTDISGNIINTNWTAANSPYIIKSQVEVAPGATLTIGPGTVVKFQKGAGLTVRGTLKIRGDSRNLVVLTSAEATTSRQDWTGITFTDESADAQFNSAGNYAAGSIIEYAVITHSEGLKLDNSSPYIANNNLLDNTVAITISGEVTETALNPETTSTRLWITRNNIINNTKGIVVNRGYVANQLVFDPSGLTTLSATANIIIDGNAINYNQEGLWLERGERVAVINNQLNFNNGYGLKIAAASPQAIVQHNTINYNNIGLEVAARGATISKNALAYNNQAGLILLNATNVISDNNIYGNLGVDLSSPLPGGIVTNNYWGPGATINSSVPTSSTFNFEPRLTEPTDIASLSRPTVNETVKSTILDKILVSGTKDANGNLIINGETVIPWDNEVTWSYNLPLTLGDNKFTIVSRDRTGNSSQEIEFTITRLENKFVPTPTINSFKLTTSEATQVLSGGKDINTAIIINGQEVVPLNNETTWQATVALHYGRNTFSIVARSAVGYESDPLSITIERPDTKGEATIAAEKAAAAGVPVDEALTKKLAGYILLQVESKGEAWYVNPLDGQRYFLAGPTNAFNLMRQFGLGVKHSVITAKTIDPKLKGRILIDTEDSGKAYYVHPRTSQLYYLGRPADALAVMRQVGLGISNKDLRKIKLAQ